MATTMKQLVLVILLMVGCGMVVVRVWQVFSAPYPFTDKQYIATITRIGSEPSLSGKYQRFFVELSGQRIQVITSSFPRLTYHDRITLSGRVRVKQFTSINYPHIQVLPENNLFYFLATVIRRQAITTFEMGLPAPYSALLLGVVFGIKRNLPDGFVADLQVGGLMHVVAASGMNVSLVSGALYSLLVYIWPRRVAIVVSLAGVWFYAFVAGLEASIVRATIMGSMLLVGQLVGKQYTVLYGLVLTGLGMLVLNPRLMQDIGFQLSFLATAGIVLIKPKLQLFERSWIGRFTGEDLTTTMAAQLATLPILLGNFGIANPFSVLINLLVLWTIPPLMVLGSLAVVAGFVWLPLAVLFLSLSMPLLWYFVTVASLGARLPLTMQVSSFPFPFTVGYYLLLGSWLLVRKIEESE